MYDFLFLFALYVIYFWLVEFTPSFILNIQTNRLYKKNLKMLMDSRDEYQKHLQENKKDTLYIDSVKGMDKVIKKLKENRNMVLKLIGRYQDGKKNYRRVLKIWKEFLTNLEEYNNAWLNKYLGMSEVMDEDRQIELRNKLLTGEKTLKEISESIFTP